MRTGVVLAVTTLLVVAALPAGVVPAAADGFVSVSTTVDDQPTVEESFTLTANVTNADDSTESYRVTEAVVREGSAESSDEIAESDPSVRIRPGQTRSVSVETTLNESGRQTVYIHLTVLDGNGDRRTVVQPVTVTVRDPHPQIGVSAESAAPGESRPMTITVSNGFDESIGNVELVVGGDRVSVSNDRRVTAQIAAGENRAFDFSVTPDAEERLPLTVRLRYTVDGERRTTEQTLTADFSSSEVAGDRPQLSLSVQEAIEGATRSVNVTVANGLSQEIRQVQVLVDGQSVQFRERERVQATMTAGETRTFRFPAVVDEAGQYPVNVTLVYTDDGVQKRVTRTITGDFAAPDAPGSVELTSVQATLRDGLLRIEATAANPGTSDVGGVRVSVAEGENVEAGDYFVGSVEASDFSPFTFGVPAAGNVSSVPVEVSYVVDGVRRSYTTELSVTVVRTPARDTSGGGGLPLLPILGVVALLIVAGVVAYRRR